MPRDALLFAVFLALCLLYLRAAYRRRRRGQLWLPLLWVIAAAVCFAVAIVSAYRYMTG